VKNCALVVSDENKLFSLCPKRCQDVTLKNLAGLLHQQHTRTGLMDILPIFGSASRGTPNDALAGEDCSILLPELAINQLLVAIVFVSGGTETLDGIPPHLLPPSRDLGSTIFLGH